MHLVTGGAAVSHRDLVSVIPYSSVAMTNENDDEITARHDPRRPEPTTQSVDIQLSPQDRQDAIRTFISHLENLEPETREELLPADDSQSSPGRRVTSVDLT